MKTWQLLTVCGTILTATAIGATVARYQITGHMMGVVTTVIKLDRWTGQTWRLHVTQGWIAITSNPFDQFDPFASGQATPSP